MLDGKVAKRPTDRPETTAAKAPNRRPRRLGQLAQVEGLFVATPGREKRVRVAVPWKVPGKALPENVLPPRGWADLDNTDREKLGRGLYWLRQQPDVLPPMNDVCISAPLAEGSKALERVLRILKACSAAHHLRIVPTWPHLAAVRYPRGGCMVFGCAAPPTCVAEAEAGYPLGNLDVAVTEHHGAFGHLGAELAAAPVFDKVEPPAAAPAEGP